MREAGRDADQCAPQLHPGQLGADAAVQSVAEREGNALRVDYLRGSGPRAEPFGIPRPHPVPLPAPTPRRIDDDVASSGAAQQRVSQESGNLFTLVYTNRDEFGNPYSPTNELRVNDRGTRRDAPDGAERDRREDQVLHRDLGRDT